MLSVIMPAYNRAHVITKAIKSVLNQTFTDFELIIVNDCSTDSTVDVINSFSDSRILLINASKNMGAAAARNVGIKNAKYEIISLLDSDDFYEPTFLEESYHLLKNTNDQIGFMWTGLKTINNNKITLSHWEPPFIKSNYITFLHALHIGTNSGISIKKSVFEKCGYFNESLPAAEDTDFFLRITQEFGYTFTHNHLININKSGEDRLSKNYKKIAIAYNFFIDQHLPIINKYPKLQKKYLYKLMWLNYHLGEKEIARSYYQKLKKLQMVNIKSRRIYLLFETLPLKLASYIHVKFGH